MRLTLVRFLPVLALVLTVIVAFLLFILIVFGACSGQHCLVFIVPFDRFRRSFVPIVTLLMFILIVFGAFSDRGFLRFCRFRGNETAGSQAKKKLKLVRYLFFVN